MVPDKKEPVAQSLKEVNDRKVVLAYRNRYGHQLDKYESDMVKVKRGLTLKEVMGDDKAGQIPCLKERYIYIPWKIQSENHENCTSVLM